MELSVSQDGSCDAGNWCAGDYTRLLRFRSFRQARAGLYLHLTFIESCFCVSLSTSLFATSPWYLNGSVVIVPEPGHAPDSIVVFCKFAVRSSLRLRGRPCMANGGPRHSGGETLDAGPIDWRK